MKEVKTILLGAGESCDISPVRPHGTEAAEERIVLVVNEIDTSGLPPGAYFWEVSLSPALSKGEVQRVKSGKLVKMQ